MLRNMVKRGAGAWWTEESEMVETDWKRGARSKENRSRENNMGIEEGIETMEEEAVGDGNRRETR